MTPKGKPLEHSLMVKDHYEALNATLEWAPSKREISPALIQDINALVMQHTGSLYHTIFGAIDGSKGMFRKGNVSAGDTYFVNFDKVEKLVTDLSKKLNNALNTSQKKSKLWKFLS